MKSLPDSEIKQLATKPGPKQHLAFDELARRIRDNPSSWSQPERPWSGTLSTSHAHPMPAKWSGRYLSGLSD